MLSLDTLDEVDSYHVPSGVSIIRFADLSCKLFLAGCDNGDLISGYSCDLSMSCKVAVRQAHDSTISSIDMNTFSSEDQSIFTSGWEGDIKIWDLSHLETSPLIKLSRAHYGHINSISILKSKSHAASLISVGDDGFARLWDPRAVNRNCCGIVNLHQRGNACLWDSMDPLCFHVGTEDGSLLLFDTRKLGDSFESGGQDAILSKISVHSARVRQLRQYEGSSMLFSCSDDFTVASLDIQKIKALGVDTPGVHKISR